MRFQQIALLCDMIQEALIIWNRLAIPKRNESFTIERLANSNVFLAKDYKGSLGFILVNSDVFSSDLRLKHFEISFYKELQNKSGNCIERDCLVFLADVDVDSELLIRVIVAINDFLTTGTISGSYFIKVIREIVEFFLLVPTGRSQVVGVWGELFFLNFLVKNFTMDVFDAITVVRSWEGTSSRKIVDFIFKHRELAVEVKTTTSSNRLHHIMNHNQLVPPLGMKSLYYLSIRADEVKNGVSCLQLHDAIRNRLKGSSFISEFDERVLIRGRNVCQDDSIILSPMISIESSLYNAEEIPRPEILPGVLNLSWDVDFANQSPLPTKKVKSIFREVSKC